MKFEWEPAKNIANIAKHRVTFEEAITVFDDKYAVYLYDERHSEEEDRFYIIGESLDFRELTVCHCYRKNDEIIRIISAWRASKSESEYYNRSKMI